MRTKPETYGKTSVTPYYKKEYAEMLKPVLDALIQNPTEDIVLDYGEVKRKTFKMRIYQSWEWLIDYADPDGVYADLKARTLKLIEPRSFRITTKKTYASNLTFKREPQSNRNSPIGRPPQRHAWSKHKLVAFMADSQLGEVFDLNEPLDQDAREAVAALIDESPDFEILSLTKSGAKIGRINE